MGRIQTAFVSGTITNNPLAIGDLTLNSAALSSLAAVAAPDIAAIVLDPAGVSGVPEVVWVTAHTGAATSATIVRAKEGTSARQFAVGTQWVHGPTITDFGAGIPEYLAPLIPVGSTLSNAIVAANQAYLCPIIPIQANVTVTTLVNSIGVQSGNVDIGIYDWDGTTFTRITTLGSTACPVAATRVVFNVTDATLYRGTRYFFGFAADNGTVTIGTYTTPGIFNFGPCWIKAASFPLPATITSPSGSSTTMPSIFGNVSGGLAI